MGLEAKHIKPTPKSTYLPVAWSTEQWSLKVSLAFTNGVESVSAQHILYCPEWTRKVVRLPNFNRITIWDHTWN